MRLRIQISHNLQAEQIFYPTFLVGTFNNVIFKTQNKRSVLFSLTLHHNSREKRKGARFILNVLHASLGKEGNAEDLTLFTGAAFWQVGRLQQGAQIPVQTHGHGNFRTTFYGFYLFFSEPWNRHPGVITNVKIKSSTCPMHGAFFHEKSQASESGESGELGASLWKQGLPTTVFSTALFSSGVGRNTPESGWCGIGNPQLWCPHHCPIITAVWATGGPTSHRELLLCCKQTWGNLQVGWVSSARRCFKRSKRVSYTVNIQNWNGKHLKTTLPWIKYFWSWIKGKQKAWLACQILSAVNFKVWVVLFTWKRSQETNLALSIFITFFRLYGWLNQSRVPILIFFFWEVQPSVNWGTFLMSSLCSDTHSLLF